MLPTNSKAYLPVLDAMRGIAAVSVCWFHLTNAQFSEVFSAYKASGQIGWLGVQVFFVISGFVIPFSLFLAGYRINAFFKFLLKRILRLDPPYLCSVAFVVCAYYMSSLISRTVPPYSIPWLQVAAHIGYLNAFAGLPLFQMSYWSLAIEFQYYLFVGLVFPMLARPGYAESATIYAAIALTSLLAGHNKAFLPQFLPLFLIGITVFRFKCLGIHWLDLTLGIGIGVILVFFLQGPPPAIAGLASALTILFVNGTTRLLTFFGKISYSLYLMHVIVGDIVYGLAVRHASHPGLLRWVLPFIALGVAIAIAFILYRVVEVPSKRWSSAIRYDTQILPSLVEVAS